VCVAQVNKLDTHASNLLGHERVSHRPFPTVSAARLAAQPRHNCYALDLGARERALCVGFTE
jgi:hypothetical protein